MNKSSNTLKVTDGSTLTVDQIIEWRGADGMLYHARVTQPATYGTLKVMCLHSGRILELNSEAVVGVCQDYKE